jgi:hypothetical protein
LLTEKLAEEGEKTTRKNGPGYANAAKPNRMKPLSCAVQDGAILPQGVYRMLAVQGYRMGAKGHPRLYYFL